MLPENRKCFILYWYLITYDEDMSSSPTFYKSLLSSPPAEDDSCEFY